MDRVSRNQVESAKSDLKSGLELLPTFEELKNSYDKINDTVILLKECWNTTGNFNNNPDFKGKVVAMYKID